jgi:hypothetical protein
LDNGRIAAVGTHAQLLATSPAYRNVISSLADTDQAAREDRNVTDATVELEIIQSAGVEDDARETRSDTGATS